MSRSPDFLLDDILDAGNAISSYTSGYDFNRFRDDPKTIDAVVRRFEIIGEAVKRLPSEWTEREPEIPRARDSRIPKHTRPRVFSGRRRNYLVGDSPGFEAASGSL